MFGAFFITQFQCSVIKVIEIGPIQNGVLKSGHGFEICLLVIPLSQKGDRSAHYYMYS